MVSYISLCLPDTFFEKKDIKNIKNVVWSYGLVVTIMPLEFFEKKNAAWVNHSLALAFFEKNKK